MAENQSFDNTGIQHIHAVAFSINSALVVIAIVLLYVRYGVISRFNQVEFAVNRLLHIRQTDLVLGYWKFLFPGAALGVCIWISLQLSLRTRFTREVLRSVAGIIALCAPPAYWLCAAYAASQRYGWSPFHAVQLYEVALILIFASLYVCGKWPLPEWAGVVIVLAHYGFWFWQFWPQLLGALEGYGGAPGLISLTDFFAVLSWMLYIRLVDGRSSHSIESQASIRGAQ